MSLNWSSSLYNSLYIYNSQVICIYHMSVWVGKRNVIEWCFSHVLSGNSRVICTIQLLGVERKNGGFPLDTSEETFDKREEERK